LAENLTERQRDITLLSKSFLLRTHTLNDPEVKASINRLTDSYSHYSWVGVADTKGVVRSAINDLLVGDNVSQRPWFIDGQKTISVEDVHEALLLAKLLQPYNQSSPLRFIDFSAPIKDDKGVLRGVLGAHINWRWSDDIIKHLRYENVDSNAMEILIINAANKIIYPEHLSKEKILPDYLSGPTGYRVGHWGTDISYVSALAPIESGTLISSLGWRVVACQPSHIALQPVYALQKTLFVIALISGLVFIALVLWLARTLSNPLERLAHHAKLVERGDENHPLNIESGTAEISHLINAIRGMTTTLIQRRQEVNDINFTLEQKVQERTIELEGANNALRLLARRDALTDLDNRLSANERLHFEWLHMKRTGLSYAVLLMDIDYFKKVNDAHGHDVGDEVLRRVAAAVKKSVRVTDFAARFGGEEFLVLLPEVKEDDAIKIAEKIRQRVENTSMPKVNQVTLSIGLAMASGAEENEDVAVKLADERLYLAKSRGRNQITIAR